MRSDLFGEMYRLEETYWWHIAKRRVILSLLGSLISGKKSLKFLDVGCGTGMMLEELSSYGDVYGVDGSSEALTYCKKRGFDEVVLANLVKPWPFKDSSFNVVTMLDVLEHLKRDDYALCELYRVLKPSGLFFLTVPAYPFFWTYWDEILGHKRRYNKAKLLKKLRRAGFTIVRQSYFYSYLLPSAILFRLTKRILGPSVYRRSDFISLPKWVNKFLLLLSNLETQIVSRVNIPTGLSILVVCKKRT